MIYIIFTLVSSWEKMSVPWDPTIRWSGRSVLSVTWSSMWHSLQCEREKETSYDLVMDVGAVYVTVVWLLCDCCVIVVWLLQWLRDLKEESGRHHARHEHSRRNRQKMKNSWATKLMCTVVYDLSKTVNCAGLFQYSRSNVFETPLETIYCLLR